VTKPGQMDGVTTDAAELHPTLVVLPEDDVIQRAADGDTEAFSFLYERYVTRIYNYIYYRTGNPYEAEDLTSRVFHRALGHINHYSNRGVPFSAWLYRIATNRCLNHRRDESRRPKASSLPGRAP